MQKRQRRRLLQQQQQGRGANTGTIARGSGNSSSSRSALLFAWIMTVAAAVRFLSSANRATGGGAAVGGGGRMLLAVAAATAAAARPPPPPIAGANQSSRCGVGAFCSSLASIVGRGRGGSRRGGGGGAATAGTGTAVYRKSLLRSAFFSSSSSSTTAGKRRGMSTSSDGDDARYDFDYFVIGGGSGGIASARRAASYGAKVAVAESDRLGGTCVNVGCVPKKVMWNAATIAETVREMHHYGFSTTTAAAAGGDSAGNAAAAAAEEAEDAAAVQFDWPALKASRDAYIERLNGIYQRNLGNSGVTRLAGRATLLGGNAVSVAQGGGGGGNDDGKATTTTSSYTARHILIAVGGKPVFPRAPGVEEYSISSDGFFELPDLPGKAVVVGAGYIAVELAGVLQALGCETALVVRKQKALRNFDDLLSDTLDEEMQRQGIRIYRNTNGLEKIECVDDDNNGDSSSNSLKKTVYLKNGERIDGVDVVLVAPGREPNVDGLGLDVAGVQQKPNTQYIQTNEYSETSVDGVYALGDVVGNVELTPMAIAAGRRLADRLFGGPEFDTAKVSYDLVPTVVFSHPTIGTIGVTEQEAVEKYGQDNVKVYKSKFSNLYYGPWQNVDPADKPKTAMKLVCAGSNELIVGLHVIGMGADEMLQGFGIAMKMGATKADFDSCVAIHPTAAEEFVTMFPWGLSPQLSGASHSPLNGAPPPEPPLP